MDSPGALERYDALTRPALAVAGVDAHGQTRPRRARARRGAHRSSAPQLRSELPRARRARHAVAAAHGRRARRRERDSRCDPAWTPLLGHDGPRGAAVVSLHGLARPAPGGQIVERPRRADSNSARRRHDDHPSSSEAGPSRRGGSPRSRSPSGAAAAVSRRDPRGGSAGQPVLARSAIRSDVRAGARLRRRDSATGHATRRDALRRRRPPPDGALKPTPPLLRRSTWRRRVSAAELRLRFGLSGGASINQYAALVVETPGGLQGVDHLAFWARAERPMRISVQARATRDRRRRRSLAAIRLPRRAEPRAHRQVQRDAADRPSRPAPHRWQLPCTPSCSSWSSPTTGPAARDASGSGTAELRSCEAETLGLRRTALYVLTVRIM